MKKITLLLFLAWSTLAFSQRNVNSDWKKEINDVFSEMDLNRVPTKILLDYAFEFTDVTAYNGVITDSTAVDVDVFSDIYNTLYMGRISEDSITFPKLKDIAHIWTDMRLKDPSNNTIVLAGQYFNYSRIDSNALKENRISVINGNAYADKYIDGIWQNPYETLSAVAFAAPVNSINKNTFDVLLPNSLMLGNSIDKIVKIELDAEDGKGFAELEYGKPLTLNYSKPGKYTWRYKLTLTDKSVIYSFSIFHVLESLLFDHEERTISGAALRIDYIPGHNKLSRPFIVVEGFDTGSITKPEVEGGDRSLDDFYDDISSTVSFRNLLEPDGTQQYDVVYVDWHNGTADLRQNSDVLEDIINWVNENKEGNEDIVMLGQSMGGVIARYTLARMEQDNDPRHHHVSTYISHDAPHQGSNTLLSGQMLIRHMYNEYIDTPISDIAEDIVPVVFTLADMMTGLLNEYVNTNLSTEAYVSPGDLLTLQDTPAAVQMNYFWFTPNENVDSSIHGKWQEQLQAMGYPGDSYNIAISNGNECGHGQGFDPGAILAGMHNQSNKAFFRQFLWELATPLIGIALDDIELTVLGTLPGSGRYYFDFDLKALPEMGTANNIYNGKIRYRKKLLWIGPNIWHTITERGFSAPSNALPFDSYPGGSFDISSYSEDIPDIFPNFVIHHPTYNFIPTVSALDVRRNNGNPFAADYTNVYGFNTMPAIGLSTSFDNFLVDNRTSEPFDMPHITFMYRTGEWIADELDMVPGNSQEIDCRIRCVSAIGGPERICDYGATFSVIEGADSYQWTVAGSSIVTVNGPTNQNSIDIVRNGDKSGWITVTVRINSDNCNVYNLVLSKNVYVGAPIVQSISYINTSSGGGGANPGNDDELPDNGPVLPMNPTLVSDGCEVYLEMHYTPGINEITGIEWQKVTTDVSWSRDIVNHSGRYVYLYPTCNKPFTFKIRTKSDCGGWSQWQQFTHNITACTTTCNSGNGITSSNFYIAPLPANTEFTLGIVTNHAWNFPPSTTLTVPGGNPYVQPGSGNTGNNGPYTHPFMSLNLSFYNNLGVLTSSKVTSGIPAQVDVSSLPPGSYVLVVEYQGQVESHNIIIN